VTFAQRLVGRIRQTATPLVVGLDPRYANLPPSLHKGDDLAAQASAYREFCSDIIDVVAPLVPAVKPQVAFFEQLGWRGMQALDGVIAHARAAGLLVIVDAKRGDIGTTAEGYAAAWLGADSPWRGDALTVSPYLGDDTLEPFAAACAAQHAGLFVLVKTSNPGSGALQDRLADGSPVCQHVARWVESLATRDAGDCGYGSIGAVVGATYPHELAELRATMPHAMLLVPGFGSQGGTADDVAAAFDSQGLGAVVNSSRAIIFAHQRREFAGLDWQRAVEAATRESIAQLASVARISPAP
jgi:orotidine-5'-phosphate decarboxylase